MELKGQHVRLRPIQESDAAITLKWRLSDRAYLLNKGASTEEQQRNWIRTRPKSESNFVIELLNGDPVGMLSLVEISETNRNGESARFLIGEEDKVQGIPVAVESMMLLYEFAFNQLKLERVYGAIASENRLMIKWQKFFGMKQEGVMRRHYFIDGKFQDAIIMGILKDEYEKVARPRMLAMMKPGGMLNA